MTLKFADVDYNFASLVQTFEQINSLPKDELPQRIKDEGLNLILKTEKNRVIVKAGAAALDPEVIKYFSSAQWGGRVSVDDSTFVPIAENRRNDSPANGWSGGGAMCLKNNSNKDSTYCTYISDSSAFCTAGLSYIFGGKTWMLTAGHCVRDQPTGDSNAFRRYSSPRYTIGAIEGAVLTANPVVDAALIRQSTYGYNNTIWNGNRWTETQLEITAADYETPSVGLPVRFNGANSGTQTGYVSNAYVTCENSPGVGVHGTAVIPGDSGGPVTTANTSTPIAGDQMALGVIQCLDSDIHDGDDVYTSLKTVNKNIGGYVKTY